MSNLGKYYEIEIIDDLNGKKVKSIEPNYVFVLERMFGPLDKHKRVYCEHAEKYIKPDIIITYNNKEKAVSLKTGTSCEVHRENVKTFIPFLRELGISERTLKTIVLFQYGDRTYNGTGRHRMTNGEAFDWLRDRIKETNEELNDNNDIVLNILDKVIFQGINPNARHADYIYHGSRMDGILISQNQVNKYVSKKNFNYISHLHIGPLILRPHARYANKKIENPESRNQLTLYWPNFRMDLEYINKRYGI